MRMCYRWTRAGRLHVTPVYYLRTFEPRFKTFAFINILDRVFFSSAGPQILTGGRKVKT